MRLTRFEEKNDEILELIIHDAFSVVIGFRLIPAYKASQVNIAETLCNER